MPPTVQGLLWLFAQAERRITKYRELISAKTVFQRGLAVMPGPDDTIDVGQTPRLPKHQSWQPSTNQLSLKELLYGER
jgi:hypothetical protein